MKDKGKFERLLTVEEVADILAASTKAIYSWAASRKIPAFKVNGLLRFKPEEIQEWLEESRVKDKAIAKVKARHIKDSDIDCIVQGAIASVKGSGYTSSIKGKPGPSSPRRV